jgi:hypothetical protein
LDHRICLNSGSGCLPSWLGIGFFILWVLSFGSFGWLRHGFASFDFAPAVFGGVCGFGGWASKGVG